MTASEAHQSLIRLANAAVGVGERPTISRPALATDDDVVVAAFIAQRAGPIAHQAPQPTRAEPEPDGPHAASARTAFALTSDANLGPLVAWLVGMKPTKVPSFVRSIDVTWPESHTDRVRLAAAILQEALTQPPHVAAT